MGDKEGMCDFILVSKVVCGLIKEILMFEVCLVFYIG